MKLTITTLTDLVTTIDVSADMELENFKALCALETNFDSKKIAIYFNGNLLNESTKTLAMYGIQDGDIVLVKDTLVDHPLSKTNLSQPMDFSTIKVPENMAIEQRSDAESIFETLRSNPEEVATLRINNGRLADAFDKGFDEFAKVLHEQQMARAKEEQRHFRMLFADPFDAEAQQLIADEIRRQQINSNMETAMEYLPESFAEVTMLFINCKVNHYPIKAFVDSGAQSTIMSKDCAERCNILRLNDDRFAGIARGVGTERILGKVHLVQLEINGIFLPCSVIILEQQPLDMLLGLDMLRRHQCSIDLKSNVLRIGTTNTETAFLSESEIPNYNELNHDLENGDLQKGIQESLESISKNQSTSSSAGSSNQSRSNSNSSQSSSLSQHSEKDIQHLMDMGFKREQVIMELDAFKGDKDQALAALFAKSLVIPDNVLKNKK